MKKQILATAAITTTVFSAYGQLDDLSDPTEPVLADQPDPFEASSSSLAWYERDRLLGRHQSMLDAGISPFLFSDSIVAANIDGGREYADNFTTQTYAGLDLDLEKLVGWHDAVAKVSIVDRAGNGIAGDVGGIYDPMTINGGAAGQITWLYQLWIEQSFAEHWSLKLGRTSMDEDFANSDLNRYSLSTAINGPIRNMMLNNPQIYSFPLGLWGGRLKYKPNDEHQFQLGVYQINDNPFGNNLKGTDFGIDDDDGVTIMAQYDWTPEICGRSSHFYVGIANSYYDFTDFDGSKNSSMLSIYGRAEVEVIDDLKLFTFASYNTQDESAIVPLQISAGANWKGLIPGREDDHTVFFATWGKVSNEYGKFVTGAPVDSEMVFELGHRIQCTPAFYLQPSVQYIVDPGGGTNGNLDNALVLGAWIGAAF